VLRILGEEDFGIYDVVASVVMMFSFINLAMATATQRYLNFELGTGAIDRLKIVFSTSILIHGLIAFLILALGETVGLWFLQNKMNIPDDRVGAAFWVYQISILSSIITFLSVPYNATIIAREKMDAFAYISIIEVAGRLLAVYLLLWVPFDKLIGYAVFVCLIHLMIRLIYRGYCRRRFPETHYSFLWDKRLFYNILSFCGWNLFGNIAHVCLTQGTNVLLNMFFTPAVNAAKGLSSQVQFAINSFCQNFQMAVNPQIVKNYAANEMVYMRKLIFFSSRISFYLVLLFSLPILLETNMILRLWLNNTIPGYTAIFIQLSMVISLFQALANPLVMGNAATGNVRRLMVTVGMLFWMVIPLSYWGLKFGGAPTTVFWVQIGLMAVAHSIRIGIVGKQLDFSFAEYYKEAFSRILLVLMLCIIPPYAVKYVMEESWIRFFLTISTSVLSVGTVAFFLGLTHEEQSMTKKFILQKITRQ
jgi:O-antigen/teichoic acid export membrane protein